MGILNTEITVKLTSIANCQQHSWASSAKVVSCLPWDILATSPTKILLGTSHAVNLTLRVSIIGQLRGGWGTTELVSNSEGSGLLEWESGADSKGAQKL